MTADPKRALTRRVRMLRLAALTTVATLISLLGLPALVAAQDADVEETPVEAPAAEAPADGSAPTTAFAHQVDARRTDVEVSLVADSYRIDPTQISVAEAATPLEPAVATDVIDATTANALNRSGEIVFVVDTSTRLAQSDVFGTVKAEITEIVQSLPANVSVGIVSAGNIATTRTELTTDRAEAVEAVDSLQPSEGAALYNGLMRAAEIFTADADTYRTVVVFSGGPDTDSTIEITDAGARLIQRRAQVLSIRYRGGDAEISRVIDQTGGLTIAAETPADVPVALERSAAIASNRLVVWFTGLTESGRNGTVELSLGTASTTFAYSAGLITDRAPALVPVAPPEAEGIAILQTPTALVAIMLLAFLAVGLGVYSISSIVSARGSSIDGRLAAWGEGDELSEDDDALVQTALVKRAVELTENLAEERGFLAKIETLLEKADLPMRPGEFVVAVMGAMVMALMGGIVLRGSIIVGMILMILVGIIALMGTRFKASRRLKTFESQLPDTLQLLAGTLRAGYSLPQGLDAVSKEISDPMGIELRRAMTEAQLGKEIDEALETVGVRMESPDFAWAVLAIGIQREVGGNLNELLMTVADTMVQRERLKRDVAALTAEGKMSAMILGGLPPALGLIMYVMNPAYISVLWQETMGYIFLGLGFVAALVGLAWMKKVITIDV